MKRSQLWLFVLLGPPIGAVLLLMALGADPLTLPLVLSALPIAYALGLLPALLVGAVDARLRARGTALAARLGAAAMLGAVGGSLPLLPLYAASLVRGALPLILPVTAAATALICLAAGLVIERAMRPSPNRRGPR